MDPSSFAQRRGALSEALSRDTSVSVAEVMASFGELSEGHLRGELDGPPEETIWLGGSLGRREMLPNSDCDLFTISDPRRPSICAVSGFDKFEAALLDRTDAAEYFRFSLVDSNRLIDGRPLVTGAHGEWLRGQVVSASTVDRQLMNLISEYHYYRLFDFPAKITKHGLNLKYCRGGPRELLLLNFVHRLFKKEFPCHRSSEPEIFEALATLRELEIGCELQVEVELLLVLKNAAVAADQGRVDQAALYASPQTFDLLYRVVRERARDMGITGPVDLHQGFDASREVVARTVDRAVSLSLSVHGVTLPASDNPNSMVRQLGETLGQGPQHPGALLALAAWHATTRGGDEAAMQELLQLAESLASPAGTGAFMALACAPQRSDAVWRRLLHLLGSRRSSAYTLKLLGRNDHADERTRAAAQAAYLEAEAFGVAPESRS